MGRVEGMGAKYPETFNSCFVRKLKRQPIQETRASMLSEVAWMVLESLALLSVEASVISLPARLIHREN